MKPFQHFWLLFLVFISASLLLTSCNNSNNTNSNNNESSTIIPVEASLVNRGDISAFYSATATLEAEDEATIVSKVRGIIDEIYVEEGDEVKAGDIIARIEIDQYRIEAERTRATLNRLENDFNRSKKLFELDMISMETLQNAQFEYESQKAAYELAELNLINTAVRSPISGVISERFVKKGNMIGADQQLFRVTDFSVLQAILHVPEHEMPIIRRGQIAELQIDALPGETFEGRIKILYDTRHNALQIPRNAVISEDNAQNVYVVKDSLAIKKKIQTGYSNGRNIEVISGLQDGEIVVTIGQGSLQDSSRVNIISNL